jgi:hypothetical protein
VLLGAELNACMDLSASQAPRAGNRAAAGAPGAPVTAAATPGAAVTGVAARGTDFEAEADQPEARGRIEPDLVATADDPRDSRQSGQARLEQTQ